MPLHKSDKWVFWGGYWALHRTTLELKPFAFKGARKVGINTQKDEILKWDEWFFFKTEAETLAYIERLGSIYFTEERQKDFKK